MTPAEHRVLEALWDLGAGTVAAVQAAIPRARRTSYNTVLTQVRHLHAKGLLVRESVGRAHVYRARLTREEVARRVLERFIDDHFGGSRAALAEALAAAGATGRAR